MGGRDEPPVGASPADLPRAFARRVTARPPHRRRWRLSAAPIRVKSLGGSCCGGRLAAHIFFATAGPGHRDPLQHTSPDLLASIAQAPASAQRVFFLARPELRAARIQVAPRASSRPLFQSRSATRTCRVCRDPPPSRLVRSPYSPP